MREFLKLLVVGIILYLIPQAYAEDYKVLVLPDNIVTENIAVDSYIYNSSSEFFADEIVSLLNNTDYIISPTVSETRNLLKQDVSNTITAKNLTNKFRTSYNIDYVALRKLANQTDSKYVLLITSSIDSENYILRRTLWDFLNIPGATVIDPAYKISTYAALIDTSNNSKMWSDTFYKTISVCENRIITRGPSPQTEQLQKIKDYSRYLSPQIAQSVQQKVLPPQVLADETNQIDYDMGNIDNVFTKKYRHLNKEYNKVYKQRKADYDEFVEDTKTKINTAKENYKAKRAEEVKKQTTKLEVEAVPANEIRQEKNIQNISTKPTSKFEEIKNAIFRKEYNDIQYPELIQIEIKKKKKNNLFGDYQTDRPELRNYN